MVQHLEESQRPSQLHCHGPWLLCEVALSHITMGELGSPTPTTNIMKTLIKKYWEVSRIFSATQYLEHFHNAIN